jgi:hypothetical protein
MKKCPKGVICVENISLVFIIICLLILGFIFYSSLKSNSEFIQNNTERILVPSFPYNNLPNDTLTNPYAPPLRDERYLYTRGVVPINISTNVGAVDTHYRQLGIMNASNTKGKIIPLMGRPLFTNRDKWQYYTISDQNNSIKLPVSKNGKSCTNEYGCDKLYNGDTVYVEGINEPYTITLYDSDTMKYLPFV